MVHLQGKSIGLIIGFLVIAVLSSGCVYNNPKNTSYNISTKNYSGNTVYFDYPANWKLVNYTDGYSKVVIVNKNNSNNSPQFQLIITPNGEMTDQDIINSIQSCPNPSNQKKISNNTLTIDGNKAYENIFIINKTTKMREIFFIKNSNLYDLTFQTTNNDFDKEKQNFDIILNSFKV